MDHAGRVDVLETTENLVQEVLDELLLQRPGRQESVQVGTEQLGDEVAGLVSCDPRSTDIRLSSRVCLRVLRGSSGALCEAQGLMELGAILM